MRYLIAILLFASCSYVESPLIGYNSEKDKWINSILDTGKIISSHHYKDGDFEYCYHEFSIRKYIFDSTLFANDSAGKTIMIQSYANIVAHKVKDETVKRLMKIGESIPISMSSSDSSMLLTDYTMSNIKWQLEFHKLSSKYYETGLDRYRVKANKARDSVNKYYSLAKAFDK